MTVVDAEQGAVTSVREVWACRELLAFLAIRDIKLRYKQTLFGIAWAVIQPVATMMIFAVVLGRWGKLPSDGIPYWLFALAGVVPWGFFATATTLSANSLVGNSSLVTKVYFPRILIPVATVVATLADLGVGFALLVVLSIVMGAVSFQTMLLLPIVICALLVFATAVGSLAAIVNSKYRDVKYAVPFVLQAWMFASPVVYSSTLIPAKWQSLAYLNPMVGLLDAFRACVFGLPVKPTALLLSAVSASAVTFLAVVVFNKIESELADII